MPVRGRNAGNRGQGSKWISRARRQQIYERDDWTCVWCNQPEGHLGPRGMLTLDHLIPRSQGGTNETHNLITACMCCNRQRGDMSAEQFAHLLGRRILARAQKAAQKRL